MAVATRTHYDVLGIARDADASAVRTAWKLHVQAWHPDRFAGAMREEAERQACAINEAYTVLRDSGRRAAYDCRLAADQADARRDVAPRVSHRVRPAAPRASAAPVGSPMPTMEPATLSQQVASIGSDAWSIVRRHPRIFAAAASVWVIVFGGSILMHVVSGPSLPSVSAKPVHAAASSVVADDDQTEDLAELAERARDEADAADAEMAQLMREDAAIAEAEARAIAKEQQALVAQAARVAKRPRTARAGAARTGRVVRVMPSATP